MPRTNSIVRAADLSTIVTDPERGVISLVGDRGGLSLITGEIQPSNVLPGTIAIDTEHGVIRLPEDSQIEISEEKPYPDEHEWLVTWTIDGYGSTAEQAAARVWRESFGRTMAGPDDACCFTVTDPETHELLSVDLSEFDFESLD